MTDTRNSNDDQLDRIIDELKPYIKQKNGVYSSNNDQLNYKY